MTKEESQKQELEILKEDFEDLKKYLDELREILPVSVCTLSSFSVVVDINKTTEVLTGYSSLEIIGKHIGVLFYPKKDIVKLLKEVQGKKEIREKEATLVTKNKSKIPVSISISLRKDPKGNPIGYFLTIINLSKIKKYQKQLEKSAKELEEAKTISDIKAEARTKELKVLAKSLEHKVEERTLELEQSKKALTNMLEDTEEARKIAEERKKEVEKRAKELEERTEELEKVRAVLSNILEDVDKLRVLAEEERDKTRAIIVSFADGLVVLDKENKITLINPKGESLLNVKAKEVGLTCTPDKFRDFIEKGMAIKRAIMASRPVVHPYEKDLNFLYGTIFICPPLGKGVDSRSVCIFAEGEVDRSPTGTGLSGRLAILHARQKIALNQQIVVESIIGTRFKGRIVETTKFGPHPAVIPEVEGSAYITGRHEFLFDPEDPLQDGFILR